MAGLTAFEFARAVQDTCHHSELVVSYEVQLLKTDWDRRPFSPQPISTNAEVERFLAALGKNLFNPFYPWLKICGGG
jgi:hypothetical protein